MKTVGFLNQSLSKEGRRGITRSIFKSGQEPVKDAQPNVGGTNCINCIVQQVRIVQCVMQAATFLSPDGALYYQVRYQYEVSQFQQIITYSVVTVVFSHLLA